MGYNYRVPTALADLDTFVIGSQFTYEPKSVIPGAKIHYTLNGRNPLDTDWQYNGTPLIFNVPPNERRELRTTVISPSGRRSISTRTVMFNRSPLPAVNYTANAPGLKYKLTRGKFVSPAQLDDASVIYTASDIATSIATDPFKADNPNFGIVYEGYINVPVDGIYKIALSSYTDASLFIDDQRVVELEDPTPLLKGFHKIKLNYIYNAPPPPVAGAPGGGGGGGGRGGPARPVTLRVFLNEPGATGPRKELAPAMLFH
jgi:hexosaminidase